MPIPADGDADPGPFPYEHLDALITDANGARTADGDPDPDGDRGEPFTYRDARIDALLPTLGAIARAFPHYSATQLAWRLGYACLFRDAADERLAQRNWWRTRPDGDLGVPAAAAERREPDGADGVPDQAGRDGPLPRPVGQLRPEGLHGRGPVPDGDGPTDAEEHTHNYYGDDPDTGGTLTHGLTDDHPRGTHDGHEHPGYGRAYRGRDPRDGSYVAFTTGSARGDRCGAANSR